MQKSKPENWEWTLRMGLESTPAPSSLGAPPTALLSLRPKRPKLPPSRSPSPPGLPTADTVHYGSSVLSRAQLRPCHSSNLQRPPLSVGYGANDWDCILKPSLRRLYLLSGCTTPTSHTHTHTHTLSNTSLQGGQRADSTARDFKDPIVFKKAGWTLWQAYCLPPPILGTCEKYGMLLAGMWSEMTHKSSFISFVVLAEKDELLFSISFSRLSVC